VFDLSASGRSIARIAKCQTIATSSKEESMSRIEKSDVYFYLQQLNVNSKRRYILEYVGDYYRLNVQDGDGIDHVSFRGTLKEIYNVVYSIVQYLGMEK
jgi:hypothetical protein